jgi:hypothetical protein
MKRMNNCTIFYRFRAYAAPQVGQTEAEIRRPPAFALEPERAALFSTALLVVATFLLHVGQ